MRPEDVESLLDRFGPGPTTERVDEAVLGHASKVLARTRGLSPAAGAPLRVAWVAAASLLFAVVVFEVIFHSGPRDPGRPAAQGQDDRVLELMKQLATDDIADRDRASTELKKMGTRILPLLRRELDRAGDAEVRSRIASVIEFLARPWFERVKAIEIGEAWEMSHVAWSPDGRKVAIGGDGRVAIYDAETWKEAVRIKPLDDRVTGLCYSPDGKFLAVQVSSRVDFLRAQDGEVLSSVSTREDGDDGGDAQFVDDSRLVFVDGFHEKLFAVQRDGEKWAVQKIDAVETGAFGVSPRSAWIAAFDEQEDELAVSILDARTWKKAASVTLQEPQNGGATTSATAFSPDGKFLIADGTTGMIHLIATGSWKPLKAWWPNGGVDNVVGSYVLFGFSHDSQYLVTAGVDKTLRAWRCWDWSEATSAEVGKRISFLSTSPSADVMLVGCDDIGHGHDFREAIVYRLRRP